MKIVPANSPTCASSAPALPLSCLKAIMHEEQIEYTDEELQMIVDFLPILVSIATDYSERKKQTIKTPVILLPSNTHHETESIPLHPREYRRAG